MDNNEILANFQACTGLDDVSQCLVVLKQYDWDLQSAVASVLAEQQRSFRHSTETFSHQFASNKGRSEMLTFLCKLGEMTKHVTLDDSSTVGDLKEVASIELGIPLNDTKFERWPGSIIADPHDGVVLRSLGLPHFVTLTVKLHCLNPPPGLSPSSCDRPLETLRDVSQSSAMNNLLTSYDLVVTNTDDKSRKMVRCEGAKSFEELKQDVISWTGIAFRNQEWGGFPGKNPPDDAETLGSLGLNHPAHHLTVRSTSPQGFSQNPSPALRPSLRRAPVKTQLSAPITSSPASRSPTWSRNDEVHKAVKSAPSGRAQRLKWKSRHDLMPDRVDAARAAVTQFKCEFRRRYGEGPQFVTDDLKGAVRKAFDPEVRQIKLLALYIHHERSAHSDAYCHVLCSEAISFYLNQNYICWPWDATTEHNKFKFLQDCREHMGSDAADAVSKLNKDELPILLIARSNQKSCDVISIIRAPTDERDVLRKLKQAMDRMKEERLQNKIKEDEDNVLKAKWYQQYRDNKVPVAGIHTKTKETLGSLGLNHPAHHLTVRSISPQGTSQNPSPAPRPSLRRAPVKTQLNGAPITSSPASRSPTWSRNDDVYKAVKSAPSGRAQRLKWKSRNDLMPDRVDAARAAVTQFKCEFRRRYGEGPQFVTNDLKGAVRKAFDPEVRQIKLLALYIHHERSAHSDAYCHVLCSEAISLYLNQNYICWPWDATTEHNKFKFLQDCREHMGSDVADAVSKLNKHELPILLIARSNQKSCDVISIIRAPTDERDVLRKLKQAMDRMKEERLQNKIKEDEDNVLKAKWYQQYRDNKVPVAGIRTKTKGTFGIGTTNKHEPSDVHTSPFVVDRFEDDYDSREAIMREQEEACRLLMAADQEKGTSEAGTTNKHEPSDADTSPLVADRFEDDSREAIMRDQDAAYKLSMEADLAKRQAKQEEEERQEEEIKKKKHEENREEVLKKLIKTKATVLDGQLPPEPAADCGEPISQIRFRAPGGATFSRSFLARDPMQVLIDFVGSKGYCTPQYRLVRAWPRTNLLKLDMDASLQSCKIFPQESLIIEEVFDDES